MWWVYFAAQPSTPGKYGQTTQNFGSPLSAAPRPWPRGQTPRWPPWQVVLACPPLPPLQRRAAGIPPAARQAGAASSSAGAARGSYTAGRVPARQAPEPPRAGCMTAAVPGRAAVRGRAAGTQTAAALLVKNKANNKTKDNSAHIHTCGVIVIGWEGRKCEHFNTRSPLTVNLPLTRWGRAERRAQPCVWLRRRLRRRRRWLGHRGHLPKRHRRRRRRGVCGRRVGRDGRRRRLVA